MKKITEHNRPSGFFAVDRRIFAHVTSLGLNESIVYLVLARGTARDNATTCWSVDAIERYTGISRHRARTALDRLISEEVMHVVRGGTRPKYMLRAAKDIPATRVCPTPAEQKVLQRLSEGKRLRPADSQHVPGMEAAGMLVRSSDGRLRPAPGDRTSPSWIWLPNELVNGVAGETGPIELVRQMWDHMTLRLFIDLYGVHELRSDGGVRHDVISRIWERVRIGQRREWIVWGFRNPALTVTWGPLTQNHRCDNPTSDETALLVSRLAMLERVGLIEWVPHLFESASPNAEVIHPYGIGVGNSIEDRAGAAARSAALKLLTHDQCSWASATVSHLAPVLSHITQVALVDVARLKYRPHTRATRDWWRELHERCQQFVWQYEKIEAKERELDEIFDEFCRVK